MRARTHTHTQAWYTDGCIEPSKEDLILGDPFFRHFAVLFDMHAKPYRREARMRVRRSADVRFGAVGHRASARAACTCISASARVRVA